MSRFLLFCFTIFLSIHSHANRGAYREDDCGNFPCPPADYSIEIGVLFIIFLIWLLSRLLGKREKITENKRIEYERKLREHTDQIVKEFAEKNKVQVGQKNNIPPKKEEPKPIVINPEPIKEPSKVEEKPKPKKEFPKLTNKEREYAFLFLGIDKFKVQSIKCHKCGRVDLLCNFDDSSAGNRFRYCNVCKSHFEIDLPGIEELEAKLIDVFYLRCFGCGDIVKRVDLLDSSAGYSFKKCPSCRKYNFQTYGLSEIWYEKNIYPESDQIKFDHHANIRLALKAIREINKEKHQLKIKKKEYRTTPHLRHIGWLKKPHKKNRYMNRRYSRVKWLVNWLIDREPRVFT